MQTKESINARNNFKKYKVSIANKKVWYMDKAAPIPGANPKLSMGFVRKNKINIKTFNAYRIYKKYIKIRPKKTIIKIFSSAINCLLHNRKDREIFHNSRTFFALVNIDSFFHSSQRKRAFITKPGIKKISKSFLLNGKYVNKKNFIQIRSTSKRYQKSGDFCINLTTVKEQRLHILFIYTFYLYVLGCSQVVRRQVLALVFEGSNPSFPELINYITKNNKSQLIPFKWHIVKTPLLSVQVEISLIQYFVCTLTKSLLILGQKV